MEVEEEAMEVQEAVSVKNVQEFISFSQTKLSACVNVLASDKNTHRTNGFLDKCKSFSYYIYLLLKSNY